MKTTYPRRSTGWGARLDRVRWIGPGLVMAATAIGASHLVLAPTAGAAFGAALLWVVLFSHLFKYPAFEFGPRYAVATGRSLLDGYARVPGPRGWALWAFLAGTVLQGFSVLAGVLSVTAAIVTGVWPGLPLLAVAAAIGAGTAALLWTGRFDGLSAASKAILLVVALMTTIAFLAAPPPAGIWADLAIPRLPDGSIVLVAALLGWMPTGIDVSVWHSMWALERIPDWEARAAGRGRRGVFSVARADLGIGYGLSLVLGVLFLWLGVAVLRPAGSIPQGADVALTIARLYTDVLGNWALAPFLLAAFLGMYSSTYGVLDGFPRAFAGTVTRLRHGEASESRLYWSFLAVSLALALVEIALLRDPVVLVTVAAVASFLLAPLIYGLNLWCVTRHIEDPALLPGRTLRAWSLLGIGSMAAASALFLVLHGTR